VILLLRLASVILPPAHRDRWREEAAAVLMDVSGRRRFRYAVDTVLKVPLLAVEHRRRQPVDLVGAVVGGALIASVVAILSGVLPGAAPRALPGAGTPDPVGYLLVLGGLVAVVAARSFRTARRHGGGLTYADSGAVLVTVAVGAGPLLVAPLGLPVVTLVGTVLPGVWLAVVSATALRRGEGPRVLAVVGMVAGLALVGVLGSVPLLRLVPGVHVVGLASMVVAAPSYLVWSLWSGARLLLGRGDLLVAR
jgi:hypothetical protein